MLGWAYVWIAFGMFCAKCQSQGTFNIFKNWFWTWSKIQCCWEKIATVDLLENDDNCPVKYDNPPLSPGRQGSSWHPSGILQIKSSDGICFDMLKWCCSEQWSWSILALLGLQPSLQHIKKQALDTDSCFGGKLTPRPMREGTSSTGNGNCTLKGHEPMTPDTFEVITWL